MPVLRKFAFALLLGALPASAAELAILQNGFSIRHDRHEALGAITRLYTGADGGYVDVPSDQIDHFEKDLSLRSESSRPTANLTDVINSASGKHQIDPDFISSVIHAESGFNPHAVSRKGAQGLMQLMPGTATQLGVANPFDPSANVEGGTRYLRELLERYNFDAAKALAAYNAGPQRVDQYHGVPPYHETRAYVTRVIKDFNQKKLAEKKAAVRARNPLVRETHSAGSVAPPHAVLTARDRATKAEVHSLAPER